MQKTTLDRIDFAAIAANEDRAEEFRAQCYQFVVDTMPQRLLSDSRGNTKLRKSQSASYRIVSLSLAHASESGNNVCPQSTAACRAACVGGDGSGMALVFPTIMAGRIRKTRFLMERRTEFLVQLIGELEREHRLAERSGAVLVARLNTFSDLPWETPAFGCVPQMFRMATSVGATSGAIFYDYTKIHSRVGRTPDNYHLVGSWSENPRHREVCQRLLETGFNVAIAFAVIGHYAGNRALSQEIPKRHKVGEHWYEVYDGDESDLRFLDPGMTRSGKGRICGLRLKSGTNAGRAAAMGSGFAIVEGDAS